MRIVVLAALLVLAACDQAAYEENMRLAQACRDAPTLGDQFGTPEKKGPCWGPTIVKSLGYGMSYYHMHHRLGGQAILMYDGDELVSYTRG